MFTWKVADGVADAHGPASVELSLGHAAKAVVAGPVRWRSSPIVLLLERAFLDCSISFDAARRPAGHAAAARELRSDESWGWSTHERGRGAVSGRSRRADDDGGGPGPEAPPGVIGSRSSRAVLQGRGRRRGRARASRSTTATAEGDPTVLRSTRNRARRARRCQELTKTATSAMHTALGTLFSRASVATVSAALRTVRAAVTQPNRPSKDRQGAQRADTTASALRTSS
jgi:hypothetical protein